MLCLAACAIAPALLLAQTKGEVWGSAPPQHPGGAGVIPRMTHPMTSQIQRTEVSLLCQEHNLQLGMQVNVC